MSVSGMRFRSVAPILVVEDDPTLRLAIAGALIDEGHLVVTAGTLAEARATIARGKPAALILDLTLPDSFGSDLLAELAVDPESAPPTVLLSIFHLAPMIAARYDLELVRKPFEMDALLDALRRATERQRRPSLAAQRQ